MTLKIFILGLVLGVGLWHTPHLNAQTHANTPATNSTLSLVRYQWDQESGLPDWNIFCFLQDSRGLMWMVSNTGLFTFDGRIFRQIKSVPTALGASVILRMAEDCHGNIWLIRSENNYITVDVLNPVTELVTPLHAYVGESQPIRIPMADELVQLVNMEGKIWIGSVQEVWQYDGAWKKACSLKQRGYWYPTSSDGCWLRPKDGHTVFLVDTNGVVLDHFEEQGYRITWQWVDRDLSMWIAYSKPGSTEVDYYYQLFARNHAIFALKTNLPPKTTWFSEYIEGAEMMRLVGHGLNGKWEQDGLKLRVGLLNTIGLIDLSGAYPNVVGMNGFYVDRSGGLWSSNTTGLSRFVIKPRLPFDTRLVNVPFNSIRGMAEWNGALQVLSYGGAQKISLSDGSCRALTFPGDHLGLTMLEDQGKLWIGSHARFIVRLHENGKQDQYRFDNQYVQTFALLPAAATAGDLLVGTNIGLFNINTALGTIAPTEFKHHQIFVLHRNARGIWAGTSDGLFLLQENGQILGHYLAPNPDMVYEQIEHIYEDKQGMFWLATKRGGLIKWDPVTKQSKVFNTENGLSNNNIHAVYPDDLGYLWLPSDCGLMRFRISDERVQSFFKTEGIADNEFNSLAHYRSPDGRFYFGGIHGITVFDPSDIPRDTNKNPALQVVEAKTFALQTGLFSNQPASGSTLQRFTLRPTDAYIDFSFSPMLYEDDKQLLYAWKIEGLQKNWNYQKSPVIRLSNLPYGKHLLQVKYSKVGNDWPTEATSIEIVAERPVYLQWPFLLFAAGLAVTLAWWFSRWRNQRLLAANVQLEREVHNRTRQIEDNISVIEKDRQLISQQTQELRALDEMKSRFFTNVTHELRTPLTLILGPLEQLQKVVIKQTKSAEYMHTIQRNTLRLLDLVEELLDLSKMESNKLVLEEKPTHFFSFVTGLIGTFVQYSEHRNVALILQYDCPKNLTLLLDTRKWEKIINNLLSNALKFTPGGGSITVLVAQVDTSLEVRVTDTGQGINPEDLAYIFDRYYQSKSPDAPVQGGTGIGLSLCREYARLFGGELAVSTERGVGSTFSLIFKPKYLPDTVPTAVSMDGAMAHETIPISQVTIPRKHTILVVEDDRDMLDYIRGLLETEYHLIVADNGKTALEKLGRFPIDLVLSDVMMPEMDGFQLLQKVKEKQADMPFIMLTARVEPPDRIQALRLGVDDYLTKPFLEEELTERLRNLLTRYEVRRALRIAPTLAEYKAETEDQTFDQKWLIQVEAIVRANLSDFRFSVVTLAEEMNVSERTLQYRIKMFTGLTPNQYLTEARLMEAKRLLEAKAYETVSEVCFAVGLKTTQYFSRLMKERFGRLPSSYL